MDLAGARVLDLFAGSGAIGLETLSRGAEHCMFIEDDSRAIRAIRANIASLGASGAQVATGKVQTILGAGNPGSPFDFVFADPPYPLGENELTTVLEALAQGGWLADDAVVVVERSGRSPEPAWVQGITGVRGRRYGESMLWYGRAQVRRGVAGQPEGRAQQ